MDNSILKAFESPGSEFRGKPFWAWNGRLDEQELRWQIRAMKRMGLGGFFMHSRVGLDTAYLSDEWFKCIDACIDEAKSLGMEAWLYDEDRWPSGAAGGLVTKNPEYRQQVMTIKILQKASEFKWRDATLAAYVATIDGGEASNVRPLSPDSRPKVGAGDSIVVFAAELARNIDWFNGYTYLDTMNPEAVREFIRLTHEAYRKRCGKHFGKVVPGIFTDEPHVEPNNARRGEALPWTGKLPAVFRKRYGYDLVGHLIELFFDVDGEKVTPARRDYNDCVSFLFTDSFARQIGEWCEKNGMAHTGHVLGEQGLRDQTRCGGSAMRFYEHMQAPGMDILTQYWREYDTAKQVSSAARQFGRKWRLTETYGCTGWDFPFAGHKAIGDWQAALGINLRCQHLAWYTMEGEAKRDYPAGIFYHSPWWEMYSSVEDYFSRVNAVMTRGKEVRDLLVIHPIESAWVQRRRGWHNEESAKAYDRMLVELRDSLLAGNIDFDYGDEDILARHAKVSRKQGRVELVVGQARYKAVVVPPLLTMRRSTLDLLRRFQAAGGSVTFAGDVAGHVDARPSGEAAQFAAKCTRAPAKGALLVAAVEDTCRRISIVDRRGDQIVPALHLLREDAEAFYLFVCNTGHDFRKQIGDIHVRQRTAAFEDVRIVGLGECKGAPLEMDPTSGQTFVADARRVGDQWEIRTALTALGSRMFVVPKPATRHNLPRRTTLRAVSSQAIAATRWDISLSECNNMVLDCPAYRIGAGKWQKPAEVLRVDRSVRDNLGVKHRGGDMVQPWARKRSVKPKAVRLELSYRFEAKALPSGDLFLAIERPELYHAWINGVEVNTRADNGWWVDKSLCRLRIDPASVRLGENEICLATEYDENHPGLEIMYLLGSFGCQARGSGAIMTALPSSLKLGDWGRQGLAFYAGSVTYRRTIRPKVRKGQRVFVQVPAYEGVAVRVLVNGRPAGVIAWEPNEVDITDLLTGEPVQLGIEVIGHRRNSHGPLHWPDKRREWTGPGEFVTSGKNWSDEYCLVPCGLMKAPRLIVKKAKG